VSKHPPLLIVDDESNIRRILQVAFEKIGVEVTVAESGEQALKILEEKSFGCVLTDVTMPGISGFELHEKISERWPDTPVVIMTAYGTIPQAVSAIRRGAFEFITKPFDLDSLKKIVLAAMNAETEGLRPEQRTKRERKRQPTTFIAESPVMKEIYKTIEQVADARATVLITGESGTGKEVVARLIHDLSPRSSSPFIAASCAAIPESLLESELFGYEKGAFTGAQNSKPGRFELAHEGTLFLDEIGDIPPLIQIKLLRVLQEREFERLGATRPTKVDVRLITATNRNLNLMVEEGQYRLDLLYRLQVVEIHLPPLKERVEDILPIAKHYLTKFAEENSRKTAGFSKSAIKAMETYSWPGNVRELSNVIERAVVLSDKSATELDIEHLPLAFRMAS
jgi:two-component system response regulator AtoC